MQDLTKIEADALVFMARKSYCVYRAFRELGVDAPKATVLSDRTLDFDLSPLTGLNVALVDDSVIVGTTLARNKALLERDASANVSVHAYCVDTEWWQPAIIQPDTIKRELNDQATMTFCSSEVSALSLLPRPYMVDFPISAPVRIHEDHLSMFLTSVEWNGFNLSTELQEGNDVFVYTLLPSASVLDSLQNSERVSPELCDLIKVRAFARKVGDVFWFQFVPLVTLKALREKDVDELLKGVLDDVEAATSHEVERLRVAPRGSLARQRLLQYAVSARVGGRFFASLDRAIPARLELSFDEMEAEHHFGPWYSSELRAVHGFGLLAGTQVAKAASPSNVRPAELPPSVVAWGEDLLTDRDLGSSRVELSRSSQPPQSSGHCIADFTEVFLALFERYEIPARHEASRLGAAALDAGSDAAPSRDRLGLGLPWALLIRYLADRYELPIDTGTVGLMSLVLDVCNDLGISVPITCVRDGVVFRAYRHGEDVLFGDGELNLAFEVVDGALRSLDREALPQLPLQKILAILVEVGAAKRFLQTVYSTPAGDRSARVAFNLMGAIVKVRGGPKAGGPNEEWLSDYLVRRGLLNREKGGQYRLGTRVRGTYFTASAPEDAFNLGSILGLLLTSPDGRRVDAPLNDAALTVLATCPTPRHTLEALQVELAIFCDWLSRGGRELVERADLDDPASAATALKALVGGRGHLAIHSARLKYVGYRNAMPQRVIQDCAEFLRENHTELYARLWESYWVSIVATGQSPDGNRPDEMINELGTEIWRIGAALSLLEVAYAVGATGDASQRRVRQRAEKYVAFHDAMASTTLPAPDEAAVARRRLEQFSQKDGSPLRIHAAAKYAMELVEADEPRLLNLVDRVERQLRDYGRFGSGRRRYKYMVWYDMVDSRGNAAATRGVDVREYRTEVAQFKTAVNEQLPTLEHAARRRRAEIFCTQGDVRSHDDEKHIFITGERTLSWAYQVIRLLADNARLFKQVRLRIVVVPTDVAGGTVTRRAEDNAVEGSPFFEHWAGIKKELRAREEQLLGNEGHFLAVVSERLSGAFQPPEHFDWLRPTDSEAISFVEGFARTFAVRCGVLVPKGHGGRGTRANSREPF
jgi:hypothetical protein